jgi:hypothetical protein
MLSIKATLTGGAAGALGAAVCAWLAATVHAAAKATRQAKRHGVCAAIFNGAR